MQNLRNTLLASVALLGLGGLATPASAVVMQATYTGLLNSTVDDTGLFGHGTGAGVLDGLEFIMTYIYETSGYVSGTAGIWYPVIGEYSQVYGGTVYDPDRAMVVLSATLTINSHSETIVGDNFGQAFNFQVDAPDPSPDFSAAYRDIIDKVDDGVVKISRSASTEARSNSLAIPLALDTPFSTDVTSEHGFSKFFLYKYHYVGLTLVNDYAVVGNFVPTHLTVSLASALPPPSEVPLPAALPLLAASLSAMGFIGWRKKRKSALPD